MNTKQFEKLATGICSGLQTMQDLRNNKSSLFETYPVLQDGDNWGNLVIYARNNGLQPVCNHIRVARSKGDILTILVQRGYDNIGQLKYWRTLINTYLKNVTQDWNYKELLKDWKQLVSEFANKDFDIALRDYTYNTALQAVAKLVFDNKEFNDIVVAAVGAGLIDTNNPVKFVQNWYSYTDNNGNLLIKVAYINKELDTIANVWDYKELKRSVAQSVFENALRNLKRAFKSGRTGKKYQPLKRYHRGDLTGEFYEVMKNDNKVVKGAKKEFDTENWISYSTLVEYNKELRS